MGFLDKLLKHDDRPPKEAANLGRNDPCWCGSNKKYKKCHYDSDRKYFSRQTARTCTTPT